MFGIGMGELLLVLVIGLFLFGGKLPVMARSMGRMVSEFRKGVSSLKEDASLSSE